MVDGSIEPSGSSEDAEPDRDEVRASLADVEDRLARRRETWSGAIDEIGVARSILERLVLRCHRADVEPGLLVEGAAEARGHGCRPSVPHQPTAPSRKRTHRLVEARGCPDLIVGPGG